MPAHSILYVGNDLTLFKFLQDALSHLDCFVVRCPGGSTARLLIESKIKYSLLLFDDELPYTTRAELEQFTRSVKHRQKTPVLIFEKSDDRKLLASGIKRLLG